MGDSGTGHRQLDVFQDGLWPAAEDFPHNRPGVTVAQVIEPDLKSANDPLVITGYSSLNRLIPLLADYEQRRREAPDSLARVRILLGHEPHRSKRRTFGSRARTLAKDVADYWLNRGISLSLSAEVLAAKAVLASGLVEVRTSGTRPVHAKMYVSNSAVTVGSSNYSTPGMLSQLEANVRFRPADHARFREARSLAEALWDQGEDYLSDLVDLLDSLLQWVTWEEVLARACAELLHGRWASRYIAPNEMGDADWLWPTQVEGIAQALWVLENVGSVLVADATGSGKTKMGAHLVRAVESLNWRTSRIRKGSPVVVCPPAVRQSWRREATRCGQAIDTHSHGILSTRNSRKRETTVEAIRRAQVLAVDEAHNFLNRGSVRTRTLYANMADHVLLFTATPINRGPEDLLPLIDLLGGDNFEESVLEVVESVWRRKRRTGERMAPDERATVSAAVQGFTIRRTKRMLNQAVDQAPDEFNNALGVPCRYPKHRAHLYSTGETEEDRRIAKEIRESARRLRGVTHFSGTLELPEYLRVQGWTEERYVKWRMKSATALTAHAVSAALRSSRAALLEHLIGSEAAAEKLSMKGTGKGTETGNLIHRVGALGGAVPTNKLSCPLPSWFTEPEAHAEACEQEAAIYGRIKELAFALSAGRDSEKAALLSRLVHQRQRILAFDRHLITLAFFRDLLQTTNDFRVVLATGSTKARRNELEELFALDSEVDGILGLCSDALAEGINLQGAPVVIHLDMPTVIRLAEQRIGRVDRMDSLHDSIDVYWPDDSEEFALHADEVFLNRHKDVADILGSNVPLPEGMTSAEEAVPTQVWVDTVEKYVAEEEKWDGISDIFDPVRRLAEGADALVPPDVYEALRTSTARVLAAISVISAPQEWSFYAIGGNERAAPRWVYFDRDGEAPTVDLHEVVGRLRERLVSGMEARQADAIAAERIKDDLQRLEAWERLMLPRKKQRALVEMARVLKRYRQVAKRDGDPERTRVVHEILSMAEGSTISRSVDLRALADWWIDVIRPIWYEHLSAKRSRPALLKDIRRQLIEQPIPTEQLLSFDKVGLDIQPIGERVVAGIVALGPGAS